MTDRPAYVVRSTIPAPDGRATYALTDLAGRRMHVTVAHELTTDELVVPVLAYAVTSRRVLDRSMR